MSYFEKFVFENNKETDELTKAGVMFHEGTMTEARAKTIQWEKRRDVCSFAVRSQFSIFDERTDGL